MSKSRSKRKRNPGRTAILPPQQPHEAGTTKDHHVMDRWELLLTLTLTAVQLVLPALDIKPNFWFGAALWFSIIVLSCHLCWNGIKGKPARLLSFVVIVAAGSYLVSQPLRKQWDRERAGETPLSLSVRRFSPEFEWRITNSSPDVVRGGALTIALFRQKDFHAETGSQIPTISRSIAYINPSDSVAEFLATPFTLQDRIVLGVATVGCSGCKERAYWLYFERSSGWYAEIRGGARGLPISSTLFDEKGLLDATVPLANRQHF